MFEKSQVKSFIAGATVVSIIMLSISTFADPVEKQISALYNNIKLIIDGREITPKDANGNKAKPFGYNRTTYIPVRAVSQALGKHIEWDGKKNRIYIGRRSLTSLHYIEDNEFTTAMWDCLSYNDGEDTRSIYKLSGKEYGQSIVYHLSSELTKAHLDYNLNSQYKKLSGLFGIDDSSIERIKKEDIEANGLKYYPEDYVQLKITGDGKVLYLSPQLKLNDKPVEVNADLNSINKIRIDYIYSATKLDAMDLRLVFADPRIE